MATVSVRMVADIASQSAVLRGGDVYELPDAVAQALVQVGWAVYEPAVEVAIQTPQEHATALRQRRSNLWR